MTSKNRNKRKRINASIYGISIFIDNVSLVTTRIFKSVQYAKLITFIPTVTCHYKSSIKDYKLPTWVYNTMQVS